MIQQLPCLFHILFQVSDWTRHEQNKVLKLVSIQVFLKNNIKKVVYTLPIWEKKTKYSYSFHKLFTLYYIGASPYPNSMMQNIFKNMVEKISEEPERVSLREENKCSGEKIRNW